MDQDSRQSFDVLDTRLRTTERGLADVQSTMRDGFAELTRQIGAQYTKFEQAMSAQGARFEQQISAQNALIEKRSEPKLQIYAIIIPMILGAATFVWAILQTQISSKLNQETFAIATERARETRATQEKAMEVLAARQEKDIDAIVAKMVPFEVHKIQWDAQAAQNASLQRQVDELKRSSADTYSARDVILRLESRQRELEDLVLRGRIGAASP
ncbi:hypothetical protein J2X65_003134 [Ancylobacter sp. 3268]|uniref:hypothetical protein n=1 Tax=Ancylobacter sp. 3268 TaxID=2817752 RepID=UPI0028657959|nr:hypothetical protein [Ancylobacter sp. 3268]MDR6953771.1 hypothetical protein [Ancylobacter sp. 3268]